MKEEFPERLYPPPRTFLAAIFAFALVIPSAMQAQVNADLMLTMSASQDPVTAGGLLSYTLEVTNNGPDNAQNVVVTDTLPTELGFVSSNLPCNESAEGGLICPLGDLAVGTTRTLSLFVQVSPDLSGLVENSATVDSETPDNNVENNLATASIQVNPPQVQISADLALEKSASASQIMPGDTFDYTLTVSNQGPNTATNVTLYDVLPQGLSLLGTNTSCVGSTIVQSALGSVPVGESVVVLLSVQADAELPDIVTNTASVLFPTRAPRTTRTPSPFTGATRPLAR